MESGDWTTGEYALLERETSEEAEERRELAYARRETRRRRDAASISVVICVAVEGAAAGFVPRVGCFAQTMGGAGGIRSVAVNEVRWGRCCSGCQHRRGKTEKQARAAVVRLGKFV